VAHRGSDWFRVRHDHNDRAGVAGWTRHDAPGLHGVYRQSMRRLGVCHAAGRSMFESEYLLLLPESHDLAMRLQDRPRLYQPVSSESLISARFEELQMKSDHFVSEIEPEDQAFSISALRSKA
jgi:hypothetical protein